MRLRGSLESIKKLTESNIQQMFSLMHNHYKGVNEPVFRHDLNRKSGIILIRDEEDKIRGFSTFRLDYEEFLDALVLFSGDTIIHSDAWGSNLLFSNFGKILAQMMAIQEGNNIPDEITIFGRSEKKTISRLYWFLISKGYRTYLMLPLFFQSYYPGINGRVDGNLSLKLEKLAEKRFPEEWNPERGILEIHHDRLTENLAEIPQKRRENRHVAFFLEQNPQYTLGEELACLTEISMKNIRPGARRFISFSPSEAQDNINSSTVRLGT